jgi:plastocyanin
MHRFTMSLARSLLVLGSLAVAAACDYDAPAAPGSMSAPGPQGAEISITASGLTPGSVAVTTGQSVRFVNMDSVAHEIVSTPVPTYDDCPSINRVGRLEPGQAAETGALTTGRSCGFLDLLQTGDPRWQGAITVQ